MGAFLAMGTILVHSRVLCIEADTLKPGDPWALAGKPGSWGCERVRCQCPDPLPFKGGPSWTRERTLVAVKPDGVQRRLVGDVIQRFERRGFTLVGMKMLQVVGLWACGCPRGDRVGGSFSAFSHPSQCRGRARLWQLKGQKGSVLQCGCCPCWCYLQGA